MENKYYNELFIKLHVRIWPMQLKNKRVNL